MISSRTIGEAVFRLAQEKENKNISENLVQYLETNNLMPLLAPIVKYLEHRNETKKTQEQLTIVSAFKISDEQIQEIKKALGTDQKEKLEQDKKLLGGFTAEYHGVVYDASVATQLSRLKHALTS